MVVTLKSPIKEAKVSTIGAKNLNGEPGHVPSTAGLHEVVPIPRNQWFLANGSWIFLVEGLVAVEIVNEELWPSSSAISMVEATRNSQLRNDPGREEVHGVDGDGVWYA